jgi:hypothetical protein
MCVCVYVCVCVMRPSLLLRTHRGLHLRNRTYPALVSCRARTGLQDAYVVQGDPDSANAVDSIYVAYGAPATDTDTVSVPVPAPVPLTATVHVAESVPLPEPVHVPGPAALVGEVDAVRTEPAHAAAAPAPDTSPSGLYGRPTTAAIQQLAATLPDVVRAAPGFRVDDGTSAPWWASATGAVASAESPSGDSPASPTTAIAAAAAAATTEGGAGAGGATLPLTYPLLECPDYDAGWYARYCANFGTLTPCTRAASATAHPSPSCVLACAWGCASLSVSLSRARAHVRRALHCAGDAPGAGSLLFDCSKGRNCQVSASQAQCRRKAGHPHCIGQAGAPCNRQ